MRPSSTHSFAGGVHRALLALAATVLAVVLAAAVPLSAQALSTSTLTVGKATTTTIDTGGSIVYYTLTPSSSGVYVISASSDENVRVRLYDPSWDQSDEYDYVASDTGYSEDAELVSYLVGGSTYYVAVNLTSSSATGSITLTATRASSTALSTGTATSVTLSSDGLAYLTFTASTSGWYTFTEAITISGDDYSYVSMRLYRADNTWEWASVATYSTITVDKNDIVAPLEGGQTYVLVLALSDSSDCAPATLTVTASKTSVTDISSSLAASATIAENPDDDSSAYNASYYTFTPSVSGEYTFQISGSATGYTYTTVSVYTAEGDLIEYIGDIYSDGGDFTETGTEKLEAGTTYYIELRHTTHYDGVTGTVTLTITAPDGSTGSSSSSDEVASVAVYRVYNPYSGEHHFTTDENEYKTLVSLGWTYEGVAWYAPETSSTPVYRLYNQWTGDHHYTTDENEYATLAALGWTQEGVAFYSADSSTGSAVYRLYNPYASSFYHHFTTDANEYDTLETLGWKKEGVAWYGL